MRRTLFIWLLALLLTGSAVRANEPASARIQGLAGSGVALCDDPAVVYWNPAGIFYQNRIGLDATFFFETEALDVVPPQNWGISYVNYSPSIRRGSGFGIYRKVDSAVPEGGNATAVVLATVYPTPLGIPMGLSLKYIQEKWAAEGRKHYFTADAGVVLPWEKLRVGFCLQSLPRVNSRLFPHRILFGAYWKMTDFIGFAAQVSLDEWSDFNALDEAQRSIGAEIKPLKWLWVRGGWINNPFADSWCLGISFQDNKAHTQLHLTYRRNPDATEHNLFISYTYTI
ncbi:MAG: hypothetical protein ABH878_08940 [bacterium]